MMRPIKTITLQQVREMKSAPVTTLKRSRKIKLYKTHRI